MTDDLVKRLRAENAVYVDLDGVPNDLCQEAADRIEELEAEVKRLNQRVKNLGGDNQVWEGLSAEDYYPKDV